MTAIWLMTQGVYPDFSDVVNLSILAASIEYFTLLEYVA